jgi:hypothetical protein
MAAMLTTPHAVLVGLAVIGGCIVWSASIVGREIRCAGYLSTSTAASAFQAVAVRRIRGQAVQDEEEYLAGAVMAGCWIPKARQ